MKKIIFLLIIVCLLFTACTPKKCFNECPNLGEKMCVDGNYKECIASVKGCHIWGVEKICEDNKFCFDGECKVFE